jgi:hypothetical protein
MYAAQTGPHREQAYDSLLDKTQTRFLFLFSISHNADHPNPQPHRRGRSSSSIKYTSPTQKPFPATKQEIVPTGKGPSSHCYRHCVPLIGQSLEQIRKRCAHGNTSPYSSTTRKAGLSALQRCGPRPRTAESRIVGIRLLIRLRRRRRSDGMDERREMSGEGKGRVCLVMDVRNALIVKC